jgi:hypothetical protein
VAVSLSVCQYHFSVNAVLTGKHIEYKVKTFTSLLGGMKIYKENVYTPWRARILSSGCGALWFKAMNNGMECTTKKFASIVAGYNAMWLFLCFVAIIFLARDRMLWLFGLFAGMMYQWTPAAYGFIHPWDGPAVFFWVLIALLSTVRYKKILPWVIIAGMLFKETVIVAAIIPLFWNIPLKERIKKFLFIGLSCAAIKIAIDLFVGNSIPFFTMQTKFDFPSYTGHLYLIPHNWTLLTSWNMNNPIFCCGGLLATLFLLPNKGMVLCYKTIALVFTVFIFCVAVISEFRVWHEMIPLYLMSYETLERKAG